MVFTVAGRSSSSRYCLSFLNYYMQCHPFNKLDNENENTEVFTQLTSAFLRVLFDENMSFIVSFVK